MADFPRPSKVDMSNPLVGFTAEQPVVVANGSGQVTSGQALLDAKKPGKLNENRSTSLRPSKK